MLMAHFKTRLLASGCLRLGDTNLLDPPFIYNLYNYQKLIRALAGQLVQIV